jgi:hypothetical protein
MRSIASWMRRTRPIEATPFLGRLAHSDRGLLDCVPNNAMKTTVAPGQRVLLTNETNERTQECTVLAVRARQGQEVEDAVAVTFGASAPEFWRKLDAHKSSQKLRYAKDGPTRSR